MIETHFLSKFWQEIFKLQGLELRHSSSYHPQTNGETEVVNRCLETYLRCMAGNLPKSCSTWGSLAEFCFNTTFHTSFKLTPFQALYGIPPPIHLPYFPKNSPMEAVDLLLRDREAAIQLLKHSLKKTQQRIKFFGRLTQIRQTN